jgi:chaperonin GroES
MKIKPLFDRVLCESVKDRTTDGGIYIPATGAERSQIMTVVATGNNPPVKIGDKIIVNKYSGAEVAYNGTKQYIVKNIDIIGIINE